MGLFVNGTEQGREEKKEKKREKKRKENWTISASNLVFCLTNRFLFGFWLRLDRMRCFKWDLLWFA